MNKSILVVEDDPLLALDLTNQLGDAGLDVVGPATTVADALRLLEKTGCDLTIRDVDLGKDLSTSVAQVLRTPRNTFRHTDWLFKRSAATGLRQRHRDVEADLAGTDTRRSSTIL